MHVLLAAALVMLPAAAFAQSSGGAAAGTTASPTEPQAAAPSGAMQGGSAMKRGAGEQKPMTAERFTRQAAVGGMFEVQSSQVALQKTQDADIKKFAQRMIDDHGKANEQLKQIAGENHLKVPATLDKRHAAMLKKLDQASGKAFDKAYLRDQTKAHRQAIRLFQRYADSGTNQALQTFAKDTLPTLQEHADMLKNIKKPS
jgi:putative membrane protein